MRASEWRKTNEIFQETSFMEKIDETKKSDVGSDTADRTTKIDGHFRK
jgi:hypothetical protein